MIVAIFRDHVKGFALSFEELQAPCALVMAFTACPYNLIIFSTRLLVLYFFNFFKLLFIFERERERDKVQAGEGQREKKKHRI